jgi:hypothetical protein
VGLRVGVDLDGVMYPFVDVLRGFVQGQTGRALCKTARYDFYADWGYTEADFMRFYADAVDAGVMFATGEPLPGAVEMVRAVKELGCSVHIVTDRSVGASPQANTESWLTRYGISYDSITYSADKTVVRTDVFVDDLQRNVVALRAVGCAAFLLNRRPGRPLVPAEWVVADLGSFVSRVRAQLPH